MLNEKETCPLCRDTGWVVAEVNGTAQARRCSCYETRLVPELLEAVEHPQALSRLQLRKL